MKKGFVGITAAIAGGLVGAFVVEKKETKTKNYQKERIDKFYGYFQLVNQWLLLKNQNKSLVTYFEQNNYKNIAIYGMGELGNRLYEELKGTDVKIAYAIDKKAERIFSDVNVVTMDDELERVDAIIVTPIFMFDELEEMLMDKVDYPIISLEDVVFEI